MNFYVAHIPGSRIDEISRYGAGEPGKEGSVKLARFTVGGQTVLCIDSYVTHGFTFTPSFSFFVDCASDDEIADLAAKLGEGGGVLMPLGNYGFSRRFTWLNDRFGVSWQLNLS